VSSIDKQREKIIAIEENGAQFLLALGRAASSEERHEAHIHWIIGGSPIDYHNCVVSANLSGESSDKEIEASIAAFRAHHIPGTWHVGPSIQPSDIGSRLVRGGFRYAGDEIGMAIDLNELPTGTEAPAGLFIERVRNEQGLQTWIKTLAQGFGEGEVEARWVGEMYRRIGVHDEVPWRHYVG
jgi:hypothetical protein